MNIALSDGAAGDQQERKNRPNKSRVREHGFWIRGEQYEGYNKNKQQLSS
jgi:hypothetical protein